MHADLYDLDTFIPPSELSEEDAQIRLELIEARVARIREEVAELEWRQMIEYYVAEGFILLGIDDDGDEEIIPIAEPIYIPIPCDPAD